MIVVDASAFLEVLLHTPVASRIAAQIFVNGETLHAPHLVDLEVAQVLRRYVHIGDIEAARGEEALRDFADLPVTRYPHHPFLTRIWELRDNATAYDATYLTLAETLSAPLVTCDTRLVSVPGHAARIISVSP